MRSLLHWAIKATIIFGALGSLQDHICSLPPSSLSARPTVGSDPVRRAGLTRDAEEMDVETPTLIANFIKPQQESEFWSPL